LNLQININSSIQSFSHLAEMMGWVYCVLHPVLNAIHALLYIALLTGPQFQTLDDDDTVVVAAVLFQYACVSEADVKSNVRRVEYRV
jgi:uncharacterized membrane protein